MDVLDFLNWTKAGSTGVIYFIQNQQTGAIKIGLSEHPRKRLSELQVSTPDRLVLLGTIPGSLGDEKGLHVRFQPYRIKGEWFGGTPLFTAEIQALIASPPVRTVEKELRRRRGCRSGLVGVQVRRIDTGDRFTVVDSMWDAQTRLMVFYSRCLSDYVYAEQLELMEDWPCRCCKPTRVIP